MSAVKAWPPGEQVRVGGTLFHPVSQFLEKQPLLTVGFDPPYLKRDRSVLPFEPHHMVRIDQRLGADTARTGNAVLDLYNGPITGAEN